MLIKPVQSNMGSNQRLRDLEFQERLHRLRDLLTREHPWKTEKQVKRQIDLGLNRRLFMIEHELRVMANLPDNGADALPLHKVEEANSSINSLFLNIRGALDNAAWALNHHLNLIANLDEADRNHRSFTYLFGHRFLMALEEKDPELSERLRELAEWGRALADVRDPAAHRIPLYIPPSVLDEESASEVRRIDENMATAAAEGDWDTFHEGMHDRWNTGTFRRVVALSEQDGLALVSLPAVINRDLGGLLDALELVVAFVFAEGSRPPATNVGPLPSRRRLVNGSA